MLISYVFLINTLITCEDTVVYYYYYYNGTCLI